MPAAIVSLGLAAGAAAGLFVPVAASRTAAIVLLVGLVAAALWSLRWNRPRVLLACVSLGSAASGALLAADAWDRTWHASLRAAAERAGPLDDGVFVELRGMLREDAVIRPYGATLSVDVREIRAIHSQDGSRPSEGFVAVSGGIQLSVAGDFVRDHVGEWRARRVVRAFANLRRPSRYLNPGAPDQERQLARRGVNLVGSVKSALLVDVVSPGSWTSETASRIRRTLRGAIADSVGAWSARSAAIVTAVVIGDRAGLDERVERRLQDAGTYHVLAISGGNIAILVGLTLAFFRAAGTLGPPAMLTAAAGLIAYCYIVGPAGGESVIRATLMAVTYLLGRAIDRQGSPLNTLAVTAGVVIAADPLAVVDAGFLLTFGATAAIVLAMPLVPSSPRPRLAGAAIFLAVSSMAAEAALFPIGAFVFGRVTVAGLVLNFLAIPLMAIVQIAGIAAAAVALVWPAAAPAVGWVAHQGAVWLVASGELVEWLPMLAWRVAPPSIAIVAIYYAAIVLTWAGWSRVPHVALGSLGVALAAGLWIAAEPWTVWAARGDGRLHVTSIDVGQGDAAFVRFPRGQTLLVDAGGLPGATFDIGDRVVAPMLRHAGVRRLDTAAMTHGHPDHAGGLLSILDEFRPRDVWDGVPVPRLDLRMALRERARAVRARWTTLQSGDVVEVDGVTVVVHHPPPPDWERQEVRNDDSLVIELRWRDVSIVLTGDIGREVERVIAPRFTPARVRVMTAPHHGSRTSSSQAFLDALRPQVVVMSAGRGNTFGHPAPEVVERYEDSGVEIFRTDLDGAVMLETDGEVVRVRTVGGKDVTY